jgi:ketosteroid isomerase-like protein
MPSPDVAIRAKRKLTNRLIAAHDAGRLRPHLADDVVVIVGDGDVISGAEAVVAAFARQFADAAFVDYVRTTQTVEIADDGRRAAETGRWVGRWKVCWGRAVWRWAASTWRSGARAAGSGCWSASCT